jgi:hypothetical protein
MNKTGSWDNCVYCSSNQHLPAGWHEPSYYAQEADVLLRQLTGVELVITEAKVLKGTFGAFDFSLLLAPPQAGLPYRRLEVEVDPEQHFAKDMYSTTAQQQRARDRAKDEAAWQAGRCLVRLHWQDCARWHKTLRHAVDRATWRQRMRFVMYTISYGLRDRIGSIEAREAAAAAAPTHIELDGGVVAFSE